MISRALMLCLASTDALALNGLLARRSVAKYDASKTVPDDAVDRALSAAILAPNHFLSEPWRFYTCGAETKAKLCGLNEDKRAAAEAVPEWLVVTCKSEHDLSEKLGLEDHAAVACAIQNLMLSFAGAGEGEKLMGAIWYGFPAKALADDAKSPPRKLGL